MMHALDRDGARHVEAWIVSAVIIFAAFVKYIEYTPIPGADY